VNYRSDDELSSKNQINIVNMRRLFFCLAVVFAAVVSCKNDDSPAAPAIQIATNATLGQVLTDSKGMTLYVFSDDIDLTSHCAAAGSCIAIWPVFYSDNITVSDGLTASDFATITRGDNQKQTTYKGYPLYYFAGDTKAGDINGDGNVATEFKWYAAKPGGYSIVYANGQLVGHDGLSYKQVATTTNSPTGVDIVAGTAETFFLTDHAGRTLYIWKNDHNGVSNFATASPNSTVYTPFDADLATIVLPSILHKDDFKEITVNQTVKQLTYKGWPLYYFGGTATVAGDAHAGETRGVSFPPGQNPATLWPVVNAGMTTAPN
jgi:predicted lipoprotein with Yx(FWY)xxD motif